MPFRVCLLIAGLVLLGAAASAAEPFALDYKRLEGPLDELSAADRSAVNDAIQLVKNGEHRLALARLSALNEANPDNSSLRILGSYALVLAGNIVGAFGEAQKAHDAPTGDAYKCWFLAKIALLNGKTEMCEREIEHVKGSGILAAEAKELEAELAGN